jgi:branched-chain amino acid transport system ATP-binding protein
MLAIGRALMAEPRILLLDEPSLGLAPLVVQQIRDLIVQINDEGTSVLLVEQNANMALSIADHGYILETGKVVMDNRRACCGRTMTCASSTSGCARRVRARSATSSTTSGGSAGCHDADDAPCDGCRGVDLDVSTVRILVGGADLGASVDLPAGAALLEVAGSSCSFGGTRAIDGVSFDIKRGNCSPSSVRTVRARPRSSTASRASTEPQQGSIRLRRPGAASARRPTASPSLGVARMFQNIELFDNLTLVENLMLGRHQHLDYGPLASMLYVGRARRIELENRRIVEDIIDFLEIAAHRKFPVGMLPYGVKKRVELGRALAMEPKLLLLDEPVAGMNVEETEDMARFILDIRSELDTAMILVEHDMGLVMDLADRVMVMDFGRRIALGEPAAIQADAAVIKAYLGEPEQTPSRDRGAGDAPAEATP